MKSNFKFTFIVLCFSICIMAILSGVLLLMDTFGLLTQSMQIKNQVSVDEVVDTSIPQTFYIDSPQDLNNVRYNLYQKDENGNFILNVPNIFIQICDIDFSNSDFSSGEGNFDPIGDENIVFNGIYEGNGFKISNLHISSKSQNVGIFSVIGESGEVNALSVYNSTISGTTNAGSIAGTNNGRISLTSNYSVVTNATNVGGIAGINNGVIEKSFNTGNLSGANNGGIANSNTQTINNCFNIGDFSNGSGIVVSNSGSISNCYNVGIVDIGISSSGAVNNSYYLQGTSSGPGTQLSIDSFVGFDETQSLVNLLNNEGNVWRMDYSYLPIYENENVNYQFPHIIDNYTNISYSHSMKVSLDGRFHIIENETMFNAIGGSYNNINYSTSSYYLLNADIDFGNSSPIDIENFSGELNGNGHTISNVSKTVSENNSSSGLFNNLNYYAKIYDLKLVNFNIRNQYNGDTATGILAGKIGNGVIIENVHTENCYVYGYGSTGGLVGENTDIEAQNIVGGYILNCGLYNTHTIYLGESGALVTNGSPTGGFIGRLYSSSQIDISNSFAMNENINGGSENTLAIGNNQIGGFIGVVDENAIVNVTNCFSYGSIRSESSTIIMGNKDSFGGFIGINNSSQTSISNCYAYVVLDYDSGWLFDYITPRAFGHNSGNGNFNNNYALSQNLGNASGASYDLQDSSFHSQNSFSFDFENSWSMGSVNNVSNIPLPNQTSISILTDNNSTIVITKDGIEIERQTGSELNLTSLSYGNYNVEIYRYAQTTPTSHSFSLSIDDKSYYVFDKRFYGGSGLETSPYQITHIDNLKNLNNFGNSYFILENNINFNQQILSPCENFGGILNGNNKSVFNFSIDSTQNNVGLFSTLNNAHIQNLNIFTFKINSLNSLNTGVIAGETIGSQIENVKIYYGSIISNSGNVGGIAGNISGTTIFNAQVDISIESTSINGYTGGVVGTANNSSTISQSFSSGDISAFNNVGGFIGNAQDVLIENSYTTTNVTGTTNDASTSVIGGFAGNIEQNSTIKTSFMYGAVKSQNSIGNVGVFAGKNNSNFLENIYAWNINNFHIIFNDQVSQNEVTFLTTDEFYSQSSFVNFDFNTIWTLENTNYPKFINQV